MTTKRIRNIAMGLFLLAYAASIVTSVEVLPIVVALIALVAGLLFWFGGE